MFNGEMVRVEIKDVTNDKTLDQSRHELTFMLSSWLLHMLPEASNVITMSLSHDCPVFVCVCVCLFVCVSAYFVCICLVLVMLVAFFSVYVQKFGPEILNYDIATFADNNTTQQQNLQKHDVNNSKNFSFLLLFVYPFCLLPFSLTSQTFFLSKPAIHTKDNFFKFLN